MGDVNDTLGAAFRDIIDASIADAHTAIPAQVVAYDAAAQTVDVQPMVKRIIVDEDGNELVESLPQITGVPVAFPSGGGYMVTFPIAANDYVMLVFSERPIDTWLSSGNESDPGDLRHHDLSDAVAIPCIRPTSKAFTSSLANKMVLGKDGGPQVVIDGSTVSLFGPSDAEFVAIASKTDARLSALESYVSTFAAAFLGHNHAVVSGAGAGGATATPLPVATPPSPSFSGTSVASTKVKLT